MFVASSRVVSILCVWVMCPYSWVREYLSRLVVLVLLSSLRGRCVGCIWCGVGVGWRACVELLRRDERSSCVDFVRSRECVSNRGV